MPDLKKKIQELESINQPHAGIAQPIQIMLNPESALKKFLTTYEPDTQQTIDEIFTGADVDAEKLKDADELLDQVEALWKNLAVENRKTAPGWFMSFFYWNAYAQFIKVRQLRREIKYTILAQYRYKQAEAKIALAKTLLTSIKTKNQARTLDKQINLSHYDNALSGEKGGFKQRLEELSDKTAKMAKGWFAWLGWNKKDKSNSPFKQRSTINKELSDLLTELQALDSNMQNDLSEHKKVTEAEAKIKEIVNQAANKTIAQPQETALLLQSQLSILFSQDRERIDYTQNILQLNRQLVLVVHLQRLLTLAKESKQDGTNKIFYELLKVFSNSIEGAYLEDDAAKKIIQEVKDFLTTMSVSAQKSITPLVEKIKASHSLVHEKLIAYVSVKSTQASSPNSKQPIQAKEETFSTALNELKALFVQHAQNLANPGFDQNVKEEVTSLVKSLIGDYQQHYLLFTEGQKSAYEEILDLAITQGFVTMNAQKWAQMKEHLSLLQKLHVFCMQIPSMTYIDLSNSLHPLLNDLKKALPEMFSEGYFTEWGTVNATTHAKSIFYSLKKTYEDSYGELEKNAAKRSSIIKIDALETILECIAAAVPSLETTMIDSINQKRNQRLENDRLFLQTFKQTLENLDSPMKKTAPTPKTFFDALHRLFAPQQQIFKSLVSDARALVFSFFANYQKNYQKMSRKQITETQDVLSTAAGILALYKHNNVQEESKRILEVIGEKEQICKQTESNYSFLINEINKMKSIDSRLNLGKKFMLQRLECDVNKMNETLKLYLNNATKEEMDICLRSMESLLTIKATEQPYGELSAILASANSSLDVIVDKAQLTDIKSLFAPLERNNKVCREKIQALDLASSDLQEVLDKFLSFSDAVVKENMSTLSTFTNKLHERLNSLAGIIKFLMVAILNIIKEAKKETNDYNSEILDNLNNVLQNVVKHYNELIDFIRSFEPRMQLQDNKENINPPAANRGASFGIT